MQATATVRRIDNLGRIVIPKEMRRTLRIRDGDSLEIFVDKEGEVILKKYSSLNELGDFAKEYAASLYEAIRHLTFITDRDQVIAVAGGSKKEFLHKPIGPAVENAMNDRRPLLIAKADRYFNRTIFEVEKGGYGFTTGVIAPIIAAGDAIGAVILASRQAGIEFGDLELKSALTAASFLGKQLEE